MNNIVSEIRDLIRQVRAKKGFECAIIEYLNDDETSDEAWQRYKREHNIKSDELIYKIYVPSDERIRRERGYSKREDIE